MPSAGWPTRRMQHFKAVAERLRSDFEKGIWERLIVGCQDANWPEFEAQLHPYVKQRLIGRFSADVASVSNEEIHRRSHTLLENWIVERGRTKAEEAHVLRESQRTWCDGPATSSASAGNRRGTDAVSWGELLGTRSRVYPLRSPRRSPGSCLRRLRAPTRELADVCDAIIPVAIRRNIELFYLKDHAELDRAGNIAALLRFRADQNRSGEMAAAS